jgi:hypothetical protein
VSRHILLQLLGSLILPQAGQVTGEVARRDEGIRVVLAQHPATAGRLSSSIRRASMYSTASARLLAALIARIAECSLDLNGLALGEKTEVDTYVSEAASIGGASPHELSRTDENH